MSMIRRKCRSLQFNMLKVLACSTVISLLSSAAIAAQPPQVRPAPSDSVPQPPSEPGILIFVFQPGLNYIYREALEIHITDGRDTVTIEGLELMSDASEPWPHSIPINTPSSGSLRMWFAFTSPVGDTISSGEMEIPLQSGLVWRVTFTGTDHNPTMFCADCIGKEVFPIRNGFRQNEKDSMWVYWAGSHGGRGVFDR